MYTGIPIDQTLINKKDRDKSVGVMDKGNQVVTQDDKMNNSSTGFWVGSNLALQGHNKLAELY